MVKKSRDTAGQAAGIEERRMALTLDRDRLHAGMTLSHLLQRFDGQKFRIGAADSEQRYSRQRLELRPQIRQWLREDRRGKALPTAPPPANRLRDRS